MAPVNEKRGFHRSFAFNAMGLIICVLFSLQFLDAQTSHSLSNLREVVPANWTLYAPALQKWENHLLLADTYNNRIVILDRNLRVERQIGQIGQDPGNLFQPFDLTIDSKGNIYILDNQGRRVQVFDWDGKLISQFTSPLTISSIAVNSAAEIFVSRPYSGRVVDVLDLHGTLLRSFGDTRKISDFYGDELRESNNRLGFAVNRCKLAFDAQDNIYVAFEAAPVLQKYDKSGHLIFTKYIAGGEAEMIRSTFRTTHKSPIVHGYPGDGVSTPYILSGMAIDRQTGRIWVSLLWDRCWLYILNLEGDTVEIHDMPRKDLLLQKLVYDQSQHVLLSAVLSSRNTSAIYEIDSPELGTKSSHPTTYPQDTKSK